MNDEKLLCGDVSNSAILSEQSAALHDAFYLTRKPPGFDFSGHGDSKPGIKVEPTVTFHGGNHRVLKQPLAGTREKRPSRGLNTVRKAVF